MNSYNNDLLSKIKKVSFERVSKKSSQVSLGSLERLEKVVNNFYSEVKDSLSESDAKIILSYTIDKRISELENFVLKYKPINSRDNYPQFIESVIESHKKFKIEL